MPSVYALPDANRTVINENLPCKRLGRSVKLVLAAVEDVDVMLRYSAEVFLKNNPYTAHISISLEDFRSSFLDRYKAEIAENLSILAIDGDNLIGFAMCTTEEIDERTEKFAGFKKDYGEDCAKLNLPPGLCQVKLFLNELNKNLPFHISGKYLSIRRVSVMKEYSGNGIGEALWNAALLCGRRQGLHYAQAECTAAASTHIAEKVGMRTVFFFPFSRTLIDGKQFYPNELQDGLAGLNLVVGGLNDL